MHLVLRRSLVLVFSLLACLHATAQPLIEQVPSSAALYVGWRGTADMGPDYEGSNLQGILQETGLLQAVPEMMHVIKQLREEGHIEGEEVEILSMVATLLSAAWTDGGALYMLPPDPQGPPIPRLCMMWNKGDAQADLKEKVGQVVGLLEEQMPAFSGEMGQTVYLSIGFDPAEENAEPLSASPAFKDAASKVQGDAALMLYVDAKEWIKQVDQFTEMMAQQAEDQGGEVPVFVHMWPTIKDATGLDGLSSLTLSAGLKGKNWHTQVFLGAPSPRRGVLSLLDSEPIKPEHLLHVPKTTTYLQAFSMQPSRVLDVVMDVAGAIDEGFVKELQGALKEVNEEVGFDIEMDLIRGLGPAWTLYVDPMIAGNSFASIVLTNELQDAERVQRAMAKLSDKANAFFLEESDEVKIRFITQKVGEAAVTHLGIPFIAPAWTVHDGRLYLALYPQALEMAIEQSGERDDSILANSAFDSAFQRFLVEPAADKAFDQMDPVIGLSFADLPATAAEGYGGMMMIMQLASGLSEMFTGEASSVRMPPVGKMLPFLEVSGGIIRVDQDGLHFHLIEPFPGATLMGVSKGMLSGAGFTAPMATAVMLPALGAARRTARNMQASTQASEIGVANIIYSANHDGRGADDIAALEPYVSDPEIFISPTSFRAQPVPFNFDELPADRRADYLRRNSSFVLVPVGQFNALDDASNTVMLFQRPDDGDTTNLSVVMADGSTRSVRRESLEDMLRTQTGKSSSQLIRRQENFGE